MYMHICVYVGVFNLILAKPEHQSNALLMILKSKAISYPT